MSDPAIIHDHPYVHPVDPNRFLCAYVDSQPQRCNMAEAAHARTTRPCVPNRHAAEPEVQIAMELVRGAEARAGGSARAIPVSPQEDAAWAERERQWMGGAALHDPTRAPSLPWACSCGRLRSAVPESMSCDNCHTRAHRPVDRVIVP